MISPLEIAATLLALAYVILAIREQRTCFIAGSASALLYAYIFWHVSLYLEAVLQLFYIALSLYGWTHWQQKSGSDRSIVRWGPRVHLSVAIAIVTLTVLFGAALKQWTDSALPFADSFTTIAALVASWMVAQKILENWLYWIVVDVVAMIMYIDRGLLVTAVLFGLYIALATLGFVEWQKRFQHGQTS